MKNILLCAILILNFNLPHTSNAFDFKPLKLTNPARETRRDFTVVTEINSGLRDSKETVIPDFTGSIRLYGEISYLKNIARVAPFLGGAFENPGGSFEAGVRNDFRILKIESSGLPIGELRAGLSYYYSFKNKDNVIGADVKFEAADLIFIGLRFNKILKGSEYIVQGMLGVNF